MKLFTAEDADNGGKRFEPDSRSLRGNAIKAKENEDVKNLRIARSVATVLAMASVGLPALLVPPAAVNLADCPTGWYWDNARQNCLPPGLPKDPPNGCLTGDGTHFNGTICLN
jgi:hypothetical protein